MKKIIIITGQTATGKTDLAFDLAKKNNGEVINADSRQVYKHLDIITGKDIEIKKFNKVEEINDCAVGFYSTELGNIWLYDIVDPKQHFSADAYETCVLNAIQKLFNKNKIPILVGGTYFYLSYLLYHQILKEHNPDWNLRYELENESVEELENILNDLNKKVYEQMNESDRKNPRRLIRKIEIEKNDIELKPQSFEIILGEKLNEKIEIEFIGLKYTDKDKLVGAIKQKIKKRVEAGAFDEVKNLLKAGYSKNDPGMQTIGYKQIIEYLEGTISREEAVEKWTNKEIQYAKRQYTFMKKNPQILWKHVD